MFGPTDGMTRRSFVRAAGVLGGALAWPELLRAAHPGRESDMRFGLVTYMWGHDWDLPTLLRNLERTGVHGVELRVEHAHAVEPSLSARERREVRSRFADTPVELVGFGTNWAFHSPDPAQLRREMEGARAHIQLAHDVGASGVKVKPNELPTGVPEEQTIMQIGRSLNELARFGADRGQEIRLEAHGPRTSELPNMRRIMEVADHPNVGVCWNSNPVDLQGAGLEANFALVSDRLARTVHVHQLDLGDYPYQALIDLLSGVDYEGWVLLEAQLGPADRVQALAEQRVHFEKLLERARARS